MWRKASGLTPIGMLRRAWRCQLGLESWRSAERLKVPASTAARRSGYDRDHGEVCQDDRSSHPRTSPNRTHFTQTDGGC